MSYKEKILIRVGLVAIHNPIVQIGTKNGKTQPLNKLYSIKTYLSKFTRFKRR